jgi:hypothetical protein
MRGKFQIPSKLTQAVILLNCLNLGRHILSPVGNTWLSPLSPGDCLDTVQIRPRLVPFVSFPNHHKISQRCTYFELQRQIANEYILSEYSTCVAEKYLPTFHILKSIIFWDVTPCSLLSCSRRFGGTYLLHLQGRRNNICLPPACLLVLAEIISSALKM